MRLSLSDEQSSLAAAVRDWGHDRDAIPAARAHPNQPVDVRGGFAGAGRLGLLSLLEPGEGGTQADLAVVVEQLGATAVEVPIGAAAAALGCLTALGLVGPDVDGLRSGALVLLPAVAEPGAEVPGAAVEGDDVVLTGMVSTVPGAADADWFLVLAAGAAGRVLAVVPARAQGAVVTPRVTLDISRGYAALALNAVRVPGNAWTSDPAAASLLADVLSLHAAADAVGAAGVLADRTVAYVKEREQFGQPVGRFQAVKHHCSTMALEVEASRSVVRGAALALDADDPDERARLVSVAAAYAGEACSRVAATALQLHGGMGFTWEHDLHVLLRRIKTDELLAGTPRWHRRRLVPLVV